MQYLTAFITGAIICAIGQLLIDKTKLTPAKILTGYVVAGVLLTGMGLYSYVVDFGGAGATVPLLGFGYALANGVKKAVTEQNFLGILTGGIKGTAAGISAAIFFSLVAAVFCKPRSK